VKRLGEVYKAFLKLGLSSFGGPLAHLAYFRDEFVARRRWLSDAAYADLVALCQFLPGPASSQVGMALGHQRAGVAGALTAWAAFTLPSAMLLTLFALGLTRFDVAADAPWLRGFKVAAVAVVAQAVWGMARLLAPDARRRGLALLAAGLSLGLPGVWSQVLVIALCGVAGRLWLSAPKDRPAGFKTSLTRRQGRAWLGAFAALLALLPLAAALGWPGAGLIDACYRAGALVFGGGHVVLPLLQAEVVGRGWMDSASFIAGYGAAQAVPGPLFSFAAFVGAAGTQTPNAWLGAAVALAAVFLPSLLLVLGALPFWAALKSQSGLRQAFSGINAGVVGLLLAALWHPVGSSAIHGPADLGLALLAWALLQRFHTPPWAVLMFCALVMQALA
jgi:chromate transporter